MTYKEIKYTSSFRKTPPPIVKDPNLGKKFWGVIVFVEKLMIAIYTEKSVLLHNKAFAIFKSFMYIPQIFLSAVKAVHLNV